MDTIIGPACRYHHPLLFLLFTLVTSHHQLPMATLNILRGPTSLPTHNHRRNHRIRRMKTHPTMPGRHITRLCALRYRPAIHTTGLPQTLTTHRPNTRPRPHPSPTPVMQWIRTSSLNRAAIRFKQHLALIRARSTERGGVTCLKKPPVFSRTGSARTETRRTQPRTKSFSCATGQV